MSFLHVSAAAYTRSGQLDTTSSRVWLQDSTPSGLRYLSSPSSQTISGYLQPMNEKSLKPTTKAYHGFPRRFTKSPTFTRTT